MNHSRLALQKLLLARVSPWKPRGTRKFLKLPFKATYPTPRTQATAHISTQCSFITGIFPVFGGMSHVLWLSKSGTCWGKDLYSNRVGHNASLLGTPKGTLE
eukprot:5752800-Amphidinium_carterae.1